MDNKPKKQIVDKLKSAQNVLVTVSANPSIDQLAAAIGLTLFLNKLDKHATAVFSGQVPSTLEFLKPDETLESNTDSLRDFIISLDKSKADKLRYKVEENVVKIFITPYRTHITQDDLNFEQGDFNIDAIVALGVDQREHLDQAIMAHGRILHDADIMCISPSVSTGDLGGINWQDDTASSLCEMVASLTEELKPKQLDEQIATALLTGIVAETERFSNEKTTPKAMTASAQLMAAGANQQLISTSLLKDSYPSEAQSASSGPDDDNLYEDPSVLSVSHSDSNPPYTETTLPPPAREDRKPADNIHIDEHGTFSPVMPVDQEYANNDGDMQTDARESISNRGKTIQPMREQSQAQDSFKMSEDFSEYLDAPTSVGKDVMNATSMNDELPLVDPLSPGPNPQIGTQSPLISVQDDAESVPAPTIPSTPHVQLPDDGVSKPPQTLGPQVAPDYTLDKIEDAVEDYTGYEAHPVQQPEPMMPSQEVVEQFPGVQLPEQPYEHYEQPQFAPRVDTGIDQDAARRAVDEAMAASGGGFDPNRPEPLQSVGSQPLELPSVPGAPSAPPPAVPPPLIPPFPTPEEDDQSLN